MARWINNKPSMVGLAWASKLEPRIVNPGEVFDAGIEEIPQSYRDLGWVTSAEGLELAASADDGSIEPPADSPTQGVPDAPVTPRHKVEEHPKEERKRRHASE